MAWNRFFSLSLFYIPIVFLFTHLNETKAQTTQDVASLRWHQWDEGVAEAQVGGKKLLVDVFTTWCGWCEKMDRHVYINPTVQEILAAYFIPIKLNAESQTLLTFAENQFTEQEWARTLGAKGYPTTFIFDENLHLVGKLPGYVGSQDFINFLNFYAGNFYLSMKFQDYIARIKSE